MIHLHLDPIGGLAGDMFAAALLSAFPEHADAVRQAAQQAAGTECLLLPHADEVLAGHRFVVLGPDGAPADAAPFAADPAATQPPRHEHHAHEHHAHDHHAHDHHHGPGPERPDHDHAAAPAHDLSRAEPGAGAHDHRHPHDHDHDLADRPAPAQPDAAAGPAGPGAHQHDHHPHGHGGGAHGHRAWWDIRAHLYRCGLPDAVRDHAIGIFTVLAEAEAAVHGRPADAVLFHEVGNADSIADIVAAAVLIDRIGASGWSVSALPLGGGRVRTAHGAMPVPAPATTLLLRDLPVMDDGIGGERVTPTGAAILCYLARAGWLKPRPAGRLGRTGIGFGTRLLPALSNCVRVFAIDTAEAGEDDTPHRTLSVVCFEIDDQSGEDLAAGLDRIRAMPGVHDVIQMMAVGKKGRIATHVQVLAAPDALPAVTEACFSETTTIGLRTHAVQGRALRRRLQETRVDGAAVTVKLVRRPHGETGKAEADHVRDLATHDARDARRRRAVRTALDGDGT